MLAGALAARRRRRRLALSAQNALLAAFAATAVAAAVLVAALARHDFSFVYVAQLTSRDLPLAYTLSAFWGGQEGSLLLWLLVLTGLGAAAVAFGRRAGQDVLAWVVPVLGGVATFFALLVVVVESPFATQVAPAEGAGMTASLQSPYMVAHPPLLYLGYVGLTIPWAFAMGALLARRTDARCVDVPRSRPAPGREVGLRGGGVGRLLRVGSRRERRADAVARGDRFPPLGDDPGEARDAESLERPARDPRVRALALRHVPDTVGDPRLDPLVHRELDRGVVPRFHRARGHALARPPVHAPHAPALADAPRVARLARGVVPLQQPAARRALPDDPLGRDLADPLRGGTPRGECCRGPLLQL